MSDKPETSTWRRVHSLQEVVSAAEVMGANIGLAGPERTAQDQRLTAILSEAFPEMTIATAVDRMAALDAWEGRGEEESATDNAAAALSHVLQCFILSAPARSIADAKARIRHLVDFFEGGVPTETAMRRMAQAIERDFDRLGAPEPASVFGSWPFSNPFRK